MALCRTMGNDDIDRTGRVCPEYECTDRRTRVLLRGSSASPTTTVVRCYVQDLLSDQHPLGTSSGPSNWSCPSPAPPCVWRQWILQQQVWHPIPRHLVRTIEVNSPVRITSSGLTRCSLPPLGQKVYREQKCALVHPLAGGCAFSRISTVGWTWRMPTSRRTSWAAWSVDWQKVADEHHHFLPRYITYRIILHRQLVCRSSSLHTPKGKKKSTASGDIRIEILVPSTGRTFET